MEETCPSCYSCGMPFKQASDYALGNMNQKFCRYCTDDQGKLRSYEEILSGTANHLVNSQGMDLQAALEIAENLLAKQPVWKNRKIKT